MTSEIRTNTLTSRAGLSTVTMTDTGPMFSGITTFVDNSGFNFGVGAGSSIFTPATNTLTFGTNSNERIRIGSSGEIGIGGANYGTSGQVLTSQGSGSAPTWSSISGTSDKIEEGDSSVEVIDSGTGQVDVITDNAYVARFGQENGNRTYMIIGNGVGVSNNYGTNAGNVIIASNTTTRTATLRVFTSGVGMADDTVTGIIDFAAQQSGTGGQTVSKIESSLRGGVENKSDLIFSTSNGGSPVQRLRIDASGRILVNTTTTYAGDNTMIISGGSPSGTYVAYDGQLLLTGDETSGAADTGGCMQFYGHDGGSARGLGSIRCLLENGTSGNHASYMSFHTRTNASNPSERLRIDSAGNLSLGKGSASSTQYGRNFQIHDTGTSGSTLHLTQAATGSSNGDGFHLVYQTGHIYHWLREDAHQIFATNGTEKVRILSNGNVLIGTTSDSTQKLTLYGTNAAVIYQGTNTGTGVGQGFITGNNGNVNGFVWNYENGFIHFGTNGAERLRINSNGLVKINQAAAITDGTYFSTITITSPNGIFQGLRFDRGSTAKWRIGMQNDDTFQIANLFQNGSVSANDNTLRITDNNNISMVGKLGIQVLSPSHELDMGGPVGNTQDNGSEYTLRIRSNHNKTAIRIGGGGGSSRVNLIRFDGDSNPSNGTGCSGDTNGGAYGGTLVYHGDRSGNENSFAVYMDQSNNASQIEAFNIRQNGDYMHGGSSYSDRDHKENITAISGTALDKITQLSPKTWNWKPEYHDIPTDRIFAGFIAQEVQPHIPSIVTGTDGQGDMALDYQGLLAWTIKAVTELNSKVDTLEQENIALGARVKDLESLQNYYTNGN